MLFDRNILISLSLISTLMLLFITVLIVRMKNKQQVHYAFLSVNFFTMFWSLIRLIQIVIQENNEIILLEKMVYISVCFLPISILLTGIIFAKTRIRFSRKYLLLFVVPMVSLIICFTSEYHHLFIVKYSFISTEFEYGAYYWFHEFYSYTCIIIGLFYLLYFSIKNAGFFSRQSLFICMGIALPLIVIIISTQKIVIMPVFWENISFAFAMMFFMIAIFKFKFLNMVPIALQKIVDLISDSYIVINENMDIIDYNLAFVNTFQGITGVKRKDSLMDFLSNPALKIDKDKILFNQKRAIELKNSVSSEEHIIGEDFDKHFKVEITPIFSNDYCLGTIVLFKDITEHKKNIEIIKNNQEILMEQERVASLGQMIGGIAHNLKTPIMSLAGGIEALKELADEYRESIGDQEVTADDHYEIAGEMQEWLEKMKPHCTYMTDIISAVKGQAVQMNYSSSDKFIIGELVKRIDILMNHELKKYHCTLNTQTNIDLNTEIKGEVTNLVQVIDNIIVNAIQAYEGRNGIIDFEITKEGKNVKFLIRDYGKGIPNEIKSRIFKEMLTTKGKNGTGLGLYMSYSTIKGRFHGNIEFVSEVNAGTMFVITIPYFHPSDYNNRGDYSETGKETNII